MNINKKYIIIFGTLILLLVIITGAVTYYEERTDLSKQDEYFSAPIPEDKEYEIWCYEDQWNDCTKMTSFRPNQLVSISVNLEEFDNIPYDPYFLCYYSDLSGLGKQCLPRSASTLRGLSLSEESVLADKEVFTLYNISVYPNNEFNQEEGITIMDLTGKLIK